MATRKRSSTRKKSPTGKVSAAPRSDEAVEEVLEPAEEAALAEVAADTVPLTVVTITPEPGFAARVGPPPAPRPRPEQRRGIFFDVENTSRQQDIEFVLRHLIIDRVGIETDFTAVGNWRVIGHETARLLAQTGAHLVHSAPSTGVRDWSDLRIAVAAGVWLAGARPGDMIDVVSDDQAFDAVGDVAASLGVQYRRLSYRSLSGHRVVEREHAPAGGRSRRGRRGRRGGQRHEPAPRHHAPLPARTHAPAPPVPVASNGAETDEAHTAPHDELIEVVRDLMIDLPNGVTLDQLANALRERGFRRTPGSPRLITRLKRIKELDVSRSGMIRLADASGGEPAASSVDIEPPDEGEAAGPEPVSAEGKRRRRRRRGGRRRRGRRGGGNGNGGGTDAGDGGEVVAAAPVDDGGTLSS